MASSTDNTNVPSDLWRWSATALRDAMRSGEVSVAEVTEAHLERSDAVNPALNAVIASSADEARATARELDQRPSSDRDGLLFGEPLTIKDNTDQAGLANTNGLVAAADNVVEADASLVGLLRGNDAVFVGRTNMPSWGMRHFSENELFGQTRNPWSPDVTPGGSSGGAAAAVAAGIVPLAHANDIGGSIRYPAAVCGVAGIRPTAGRVPKFAAPSLVNPAPSLCESIMAVEGPIARHVADLRLGLRAMSGPDMRDPSSVPLPYVDEAPVAPGATIGVVRAIPGVETSAASLQAVEAAASALRDAGYRVVDVDVPEIAEATQLWSFLLFEEIRPHLAEMREHAGAQLNRSMDHNYAYVAEHWGANPTLADFIAGHTRRGELLSSIEAKFQEHHLVLTPASAAPAPEHGADCDTYERAVEFLDVQWPMFFLPCLGLPGATVPAGVFGGMPEAVQLVSGRFHESWILDAAQAIEDRIGLVTPIDPFPGTSR